MDWVCIPSPVTIRAVRDSRRDKSKFQAPSFEFGISREVAMRRMFIVVVAAATLFSIHAAAQQSTPDADSVIKAVTAAMGTARLRSVQYTGTGSINMTGQAYTTGGAWPRYTVTKYTMSVDYSLPV